VQQLLEDDSDEDFNTIENDAGYSPLHCAIQVDNVPIIKMLLEHTDNPFYFSDYGEQSPVHTAIIHHSHNALRFLLEFDNQPYPYDDDGQTLFELAILHNDLESVKILYELVPGYCFSSCVNFEVDTWDVCDCIEVTSPMCLAARNGSLEIVQFLVGIEISPNRHCYGTALYNAVLYSHIEIVKFLFANERESGTRLERRGITMADNFQNDLLKVALDNGNFEMVKLLIENDVPVSTLVNCKEIYDLTAEIPGLCAAFENQCDRPTQEIYDMISYVLDEMENKGCKISFGDDQEKEGLVHLQFACMYGTLPLVQRVNQFIEASIEKDVIREANDNKDHGTEILIWIIDRVLRQESKTLLELHESGMENGAVARYLVLKYGDTMHNGEKSLFGEQFNIFYKEIVEMKHKLRNCRKFFDIEIVIDTTREKRKREEEHEPNKRIKL
jgi:ankyrin repeat protein